MWTERNKAACITRENIRSRRDRLDAIIQPALANVDSKHAIISSDGGYNLATRSCRESSVSRRSARADGPGSQHAR